MYGFYDLIDKIKRYIGFSGEEWKAVIITILAVTFMLGFNDGRPTSTIDSYWVYNLAICLLVVIITIMVHLIGQRIVGLHAGFRVEYKVWWYGLLLGIIITLVSRGNIWWVILPGGIYLHHMAIHRLGYFRYGTNTLAMAMAALAGSLANILLVTAIKTTEVWFGVPVSSIYFLDKLIIFGWVYAFVNLLPIPPLDGSIILFRSRSIFVALFATIGGYAILVLLGIYSFVLAAIIGAIAWIIFYVLFEKEAWDISKC
jgi:Zn-dependent protease